jgi:hypothetical protein
MANNTGKKFGGRQKGTVNKDTKKLRLAIQDILDKGVDTFQSDLDQLEPKDRLDILLKLMDFSLPKLQRIEHEGEIDHAIQVDVKDFI